MQFDFYAVKCGRAIGVFADSKSTLMLTDEYPGAEYKGFNSLAEAAMYLGWNTDTAPHPTPRASRKELAEAIYGPARTHRKHTENNRFAPYHKPHEPGVHHHDDSRKAAAGVAAAATTAAAAAADASTASKTSFDAVESRQRTTPEAQGCIVPAGSFCAVVRTDGAARGNPNGHAGCGAALWTDAGVMMARSTHYIGKASNNVAEYTAFLHGLKLAKDLYVSDLRVELDSELIVKQIQGMYAVKKDDLIPLHATALLRMKGWFHTCTVSHIPRAQNKVADALSDRAIDDFLRHQNTGVTEIC